MSQDQGFADLLDLETPNLQQVPSQTSDSHNSTVNVHKNDEISEELRISPLPNNCPRHPEEYLQFYCFNNRAIICAECLVKGDYSGTEIANLKRASDKLKLQLQNIIDGSIGKIEEYDQCEREIRYQEAQIQESLELQKADISQKLGLLRQALDAKEKELLGKVVELEQERLKVFERKLRYLKGVKEKTLNIRNGIENHAKNLDEKSFCQFFSEKIDHITKDLRQKQNCEIQVDQKVLERFQLQDQVITQKLDQAFEKTQALFQSLGDEIGKNVLHLVASFKEPVNVTASRKEINPQALTQEDIMEDYRQNKKSFSSQKSKQLYANPQQCTSFLAATNYVKDAEQGRVATEPSASKKEDSSGLNYYSKSSYKYNHSSKNSSQDQSLRITGRNEIKSPYKLLDLNKSRSRIFGSNLESSRGLINAVLSPKTERGYPGKVSLLDASLEKNLAIGIGTPRDGFDVIEKPKYFSSSAAKAKKGGLEKDYGVGVGLRKEKLNQDNKVLNDNSLKQKLAQLNLKLFQ